MKPTKPCTRLRAQGSNRVKVVVSCSEKMKKILPYFLAVFSLASICGCAHHGLPRIYPKSQWMTDPVEVTARFKGLVTIERNKKKRDGYAFTIIAPLEYKDKEIQFQSVWNKSIAPQLKIGKNYLVTVPKYMIGSKSFICDMSLKLEEYKKESANQAQQDTR